MCACLVQSITFTTLLQYVGHNFHGPMGGLKRQWSLNLQEPMYMYIAICDHEILICVFKMRPQFLV